MGLFRVLLAVAFVLKTFDIVHLLVRQAGIEIFFLDWERSKTGKEAAVDIEDDECALEDSKRVSVWRTYFVANEFNEIQTHRRINLSFQLFFVLFLLKVNF